MTGTVKVFRFGELELDVAAYALRHGGRPVRLERRPMDLLILLVERYGQLVSRAEIADHLWGPGVFVDADMGVNTAVRKLRQALGDDPEEPRFIETVPGKGYRFVAPVTAPAPASDEDRERITLAVLPFENLDDDPSRDYVAAGFTEEAIAAIGQIDPERLSVIGRTSVMVYKGAAKTIAEVGRELGASHVLESTLRAERGRQRIVSRLTRVLDQVQIWSASFDSEPDSMLTFQRELASAIAEQIRLRLAPQRLLDLEGRRSANPEAYDLYLRGRYYLSQLTSATTRHALDCYQRAVELDPDFALAWAGIADAHATRPIHGDAPSIPAARSAGEAARRALAAAPRLAEAHTSAGFIDFFLDWRWTVAERSLRRAIELDGNYAVAHRTLGVLLAQSARPHEAADALARTRALEPISPMSYAISAQVSFSARDYVGAVDFGRRSVVIAPDFWIGHFQLGQAYEQAGETQLALDAFQQGARLSGGNSKCFSGRAHVLATRGRHEEAREILGTLVDLAGDRYVPPYALALIHLGLGEREQALSQLERAHESRDIHLIYLPADPKWDGLRGDSRFSALLERCGFPVLDARLAPPGR